MQSMYYVGLDVHKKTISYCLKDGSGRIQSRHDSRHSNGSGPMEEDTSIACGHHTSGESTSKCALSSLS